MSTIQDGETISSPSSGSLAFLNLFDGTKGSMVFRGAGGSGIAKFEINSYYHDTAWHGLDIGAWIASNAGGQLGVNTKTPQPPYMSTARPALVHTAWRPYQVQ
jgi:hypothetical protein